MKIIFYILNVAVVILGLLSIFSGHGDDLFLGLLILGVSSINMIFVRHYYVDEVSVKHSNLVTGLNIIGGTLFLGIIFAMNDFFIGEFLAALLFFTLPVLYIGVNISYIKSFKRKLKISEPKKEEDSIASKDNLNLNSDIEAKEVQHLTLANDLFIDEQTVNIEDEDERAPVPKKVNWDSVQKARKQTGDFGEAIALEYERSMLLKQGRQELSKKVSLVSSKNLGYDVLSKFDNGSDKYIEVKSFAGSKAKNFIVTRNELNFLKGNPDSSFVYMVTDCDTEPKILKMAARQFFKLKLKPSVFKVTL